MSSEEHQVEGPEGEAHGEEGGKKVGGKKKLIIIIVAIVLLLGGIGAGLFFSGILGGSHKAEGAEETAAEGEHPAEGGEHGEKAEGEHGAAAVAGAPVFYDLPEFLVNLNSSGKQVSFLKMKVAVELEKQDDVAKLEAYMPRVTDAINGYLRELRAGDLSGSAGMARLKEELLLRLNKSVEGVKVRNIYIKQILVQ